MIFDNLGFGGSYQSGIGWTVSEPASPVTLHKPAMAFTPAADSQITRIDVALGHVSGTNNATIQLARDSGGLPGTISQSWPVFAQPTFGTCCTLATINLSTLIPVGAGKQYWLIAKTGPNVANNTWDAWNLNSVGQDGPVAADTGSGFVSLGTDDEGAFDVIGCGKLCKVN